MKITNICALDTKPCFGEFSGEIVWVGNRNPEPRYPAGTIFDLDYHSPSGGMEILDPTGKRLLVPFGEVRCFEDVEN